MFIERIKKDNLEDFVSIFMTRISSNSLENENTNNYKFNMIYATQDEIIAKINKNLYRFSDFDVKKFDFNKNAYIYSDADSKHWLYFMNCMFKDEYESYYMHLFADNNAKLSKFLVSITSNQQEYNPNIDKNVYVQNLYKHSLNKIKEILNFDSYKRKKFRTKNGLTECVELVKSTPNDIYKILITDFDCIDIYGNMSILKLNKIKNLYRDYMSNCFGDMYNEELNNYLTTKFSKYAYEIPQD